jgi:alpha-glucoside transport system permease protein
MTATELDVIAAEHPGSPGGPGGPGGKPRSAASVAKEGLSGRLASLIAVVIAVLWTIPTVGLLISSFRPEEDVKSNGWWNIFTDPAFTLQNYSDAFNGGDSGEALSTNLINSIVITIPAVLIPISLATLAAYAFAWMDFKGRDLLFVAIFALQIVPIQVTLVPLLSLYVDPPFNLMPLAGRDAPAGGLYELWISHTIFALPLAIYLLHNFMRQVPGELIESARVDGAAHVQIFTRIMLPLMMPAIAAFAIFQFLWVWNDLLVALVFSSPEVTPLTVQLVSLVGEKGQDWQLLASGAFISLVIPLIVFLSLQRYFVRGLLAGSVKG